MTNGDDRRVAREPEELGRLLQAQAAASDLDGMAALFEVHAVAGFPNEDPASGRDAIRERFAALLTAGTVFGGEVQPALRNGDYALTSTRNGSQITAEVAHRQPDGSWLFLIDLPDVARMR